LNPDGTKATLPPWTFRARRRRFQDGVIRFITYSDDLLAVDDISFADLAALIEHITLDDDILFEVQSNSSSGNNDRYAEPGYWTSDDEAGHFNGNSDWDSDNE